MNRPNSASLISASIFHALRQATPHKAPFLHWTADNLLPQPILTDFQSLPTCIREMDYSEGQRATNNKLRQYLHGDSFMKFEAEQEFASAFQAPQMIELFYEKCGVDLTGTYLRIEYTCDQEGFWLEPHTDIGAKKFTLMIYLSEAHGEEWGTSLYSDKETFHSNTPWSPNRAMFFIPSDDSWHGFEKREISAPRKSLIINYVTSEWRARHELAFPEALTERLTIAA
ncbi:2OG-Fe(II) oxygenase [Pseudovibrio sp. JE062]|uniref:2OG-Fe(II) oxygenase n=1 Tax=Pseudovibrio sp. JE062 TaxID=439495 RepID=UPI000186B9DE|nr:2OG-Fe(II) oxygenase [Pseudovibrio sp. JE062]EEA92000.1 conserved hypothetical protein [Pseudovibrio sp. JE062]